MLAEALIKKKKQGKELSPDELKALLGDWLRRRITDEAMIKFLQAVRGRGLTFNEMVALMQLLVLSDQVLKQTPLPGKTAELHSIEGVGERVQLMVGAIVSAVGVSMLELSGPGMGYSLSPLDRLSGLPGFNGKPEMETMLYHVTRQRFGVMDTPWRLAPAAGRLYELCREAGVLTPVPFFVILEMARVLAGGAEVILLDVPFGPDCIVDNLHDAVMLARTMCALGETAGRRMGAVVSKLEVAPGYTVGPLLEFAEAVQTLDGGGDPVLLEIAVDLATRILYLAGLGDMENCRRRAERVVGNGAATDKLLDMAEEQGADPDCLDNLELLPQAHYSHPVRATRNGWLRALRPDRLGQAAIALKASRRLPGEDIAEMAGISLKKHYGDFVKKGEEIATLYAVEKGKFSYPADMVRRAFAYGDLVPPPVQYFFAWVDGTEAELLLPPEAPKVEKKDNVLRPKFPRGEEK